MTKLEILSELHDLYDNIFILGSVEEGKKDLSKLMDKISNDIYYEKIRI